MDAKLPLEQTEGDGDVNLLNIRFVLTFRNELLVPTGNDVEGLFNK